MVDVEGGPASGLNRGNVCLELLCRTTYPQRAGLPAVPWHRPLLRWSRLSFTLSSLSYFSTLLNSVGIRERNVYTSTQSDCHRKMGARERKGCLFLVLPGLVLCLRLRCRETGGYGTGSQEGKANCFSVPFRISQIAKLWTLAIFKYPFKKQWYKWFVNVYFHTRTVLQKTEFSFKSFIF